MHEVVVSQRWVQVRYYEVTEEELEVARKDFASGKFPLEVSEEAFDFGEHAAFCDSALPFSLNACLTCIVLLCSDVDADKR